MRERERAVTQSLRPLLFVRELYCFNRRYRPFRGDAASRRDCPDGGAGFRAAHPVLFNATGFAHHPYGFDRPPAASDSPANPPFPNMYKRPFHDPGRPTSKRISGWI